MLLASKPAVNKVSGSFFSGQSMTIEMWRRFDLYEEFLFLRIVFNILPALNIAKVN
jgi:hypothetical protein